jgi:hypothetical protein
MTTLTDAMLAISAVCHNRRKATELVQLFIEGDRVIADINTLLEDPRSLSPLFSERGYDVIQIQHLGGYAFQYTMIFEEGD